VLHPSILRSQELVGRKHVYVLSKYEKSL
jgi:hypothetical protein